MDLQLVVRYFTVKSTDLFTVQVFYRKIYGFFYIATHFKLSRYEPFIVKYNYIVRCNRYPIKRRIHNLIQTEFAQVFGVFVCQRVYPVTHVA